MAKGVLVAVVILLFLAGFLLIMYSLFSPISMLPRLSNTTANMDAFHVTPQNFNIGRVRFYEPVMLNQSYDMCNSTSGKQVVILNIVYNTARAPDICQISVDDKLQKSIRLYDIPCTENCSREMNLAVDLKPASLYEEHVIELCCSSVCTKRNLDAYC